MLPVVVWDFVLLLVRYLWGLVYDSAHFSLVEFMRIPVLNPQK